MMAGLPLMSLVLMATSCHAWTTGRQRPYTAFRSNTALLGVPPTMYIDTASDVRERPFRFLRSLFAPPRPSIQLLDDALDTPAAAVPTHGMPWKESICANYTAANEHLFYMPFWQWQMHYMTQHLTNLRAVPVVSRTGRDMSYVENNVDTSTAPTMRMHTCCFTCDEYKLIRLTTLDAGWRTQVFTSLWYPAETTDPVLGIDLLQFNHAKKTLCIVDFQPVETMVDDEPEFESLLRPIRNNYPSLQGEMTDRFYNREDSFFSKQMLLGRHSALSAETETAQTYSAQSMVYDDLFPAFQQYVATHVDMVKTKQREQRGSATLRGALDAAHTIRSRHQAYDTYSAARDPAHGLLAKCFGQEWADEYVYDILFPLAIRETAKP